MRPSRTLRATRAGWCFIAIIFGVGFAALNTGNNLLYVVLSLMLAFLVLSGLLSETSLRGIRIERVLPKELFAQCENRVVLRIHNTQMRNASFAISIEDRLEADDRVDRAGTRGGTRGRNSPGTSAGTSAGRLFVLRIGPDSRLDRSYQFVPARRGDIHFSKFRVSTRFPFSLFIKSREMALPESALVYPAIESVTLRDSQSQSDSHHDEIANLLGDGAELVGLREFVPGDSRSRVHWRSSVRMGRLLVGERDGLTERELEIHLQLPSDAPERVIEERIAFAASEIVTHLDTGFRVGLQSAAARFPAASGSRHRSQLLTYLARATPHDTLDSAPSSPTAPPTSTVPS